MQPPTTVTSIAQGLVVEGGDSATLAAALALALDYRGDVTITQRDGRVVEGYVFDRRGDRRGDRRADQQTDQQTDQRADRATTPDPIVRILPKDSDERVVVREADIARLEVTGRDTASGKTFENWVKRYVEQRMKGEQASIESDSLE